MKILAITILKVFWAAYLAGTSLYCLLAFMPYTYYAVIKAPISEWVPWFASHHVVLYWATLFSALYAFRGSGNRRRNAVLSAFQFTAGICLTVRPVLTNIQNDKWAFWWSLAALLPILLVAGSDAIHHLRTEDPGPTRSSSLSFATAALAGAIVALVSAAGVHVQTYARNGTFQFGIRDLELTAWSTLTHVLTAVIVVSLLNLIAIVSLKTARPNIVRKSLVALVMWIVLWTACLRFLENALTFHGWAAQLYSGLLAAALTCVGLSVALQFLSAQCKPIREETGPRRNMLPAASLLCLILLALVMPIIVDGRDWGGILQGTFALTFLFGLTACIYLLRRQRASYSMAGIVSLVLLSLFIYKALQFSQIAWAKPLGPTDDDIATAMEKYAEQDTSFSLTHHLLNPTHAEPCGDLCAILRQYTNIRGARVTRELELVENLDRSPVMPPNIFLFVIDSLRPDYLGAYNPKVDFTPNLDDFARDSVVLRNVYTQYAGTSLSEPAIWSGAMLLHAHYMQPFARLNSLEKLVTTEGFRMIVSMDDILPELLSPSDNLIKLDTDKHVWNNLEVCSTVQQTMTVLDGMDGGEQPVFFYAQPKNVHQFAINPFTRSWNRSWKRPGFNSRISLEVHQVDECLGKFVAYLRSHNMYENSIIIVTSDHGDATGEFGRSSHSLTIFPEIMRVPLIVRLPKSMRKKLVYDDSRVGTLTDITPTLYYLLGHRPIQKNPIFGRPLLAESMKELESSTRDEILLASDARAVFGILAENGRFMYVTYDSPARSFLFDLGADPNAEHNIVTDTLKKHYDTEIIQQLQTIAEFYRYKPSPGSLFASKSP